MRLTFFIVACLIYLPSCEYTLPVEPSPPLFSAGTADFQRIAILGGSQGAGFMDGALYSEAQDNSIGAILANQINLTKPEIISFVQPAISSLHGFNRDASLPGLRGKSFLKFISPGSSQLFKDTNPGELPGTYTGPVINNFSVPLLRTYQIMDPGLAENLYYARFATQPGNSTLLEQLVGIDPTLIILQIGWDDILPFATSGLTGNRDPDPGNIQSTDLTPKKLFQSSLQQVVEVLINDTNAEIIISNLPDISQFPFFNSISNIAPISGQEAGSLQSFYREYNLQVTRYNANSATPRPVIRFFSDDPPHLWKVIVEDPTLADVTLEDGSQLAKYRQMTDGEYVLWSVPKLPTALDEGFGTFQPIPKRYFFSKEDVEDIQGLVNEFNQIIHGLAASNSRMLLLDWYKETNRWSQDGLVVDGVLHSYDFRRTGIFSSDGLTLNQRGTAIFTNHIIKLINQHFGSNIQPPGINGFPGNVFVNDF